MGKFIGKSTVAMIAIWLILFCPNIVFAQEEGVATQDVAIEQSVLVAAGTGDRLVAHGPDGDLFLWMDTSDGHFAIQLNSAADTFELNRTTIEEFDRIDPEWRSKLQSEDSNLVLQHLLRNCETCRTTFPTGWVFYNVYKDSSGKWRRGGVRRVNCAACQAQRTRDCILLEQSNRQQQCVECIRCYCAATKRELREKFRVCSRS